MIEEVWEKSKGLFYAAAPQLSLLEVNRKTDNIFPIKEASFSGSGFTVFLLKRTFILLNYCLAIFQFW